MRHLEGRFHVSPCTSPYRKGTIDPERPPAASQRPAPYLRRAGSFLLSLRPHLSHPSPASLVCSWENHNPLGGGSWFLWTTPG